MYGLFRHPSHHDPMGLKHASNKGSKNLKSSKSQGDMRLKRSKSLAETKDIMKSYVQPPVVNMPVSVEYSVAKKAELKPQPKLELKPQPKLVEPMPELRPESKRESRLEIDIDETTRELITARLKQVGKVARSPSKKSTTKRTKNEIKLAVLAKFEALAEENPDFKNFIESHPEYLETIGIDELRETEYSRLDNLGHIYLDYTGGSLYPESLVRRHSDLLVKGVFGNPHSSNPTSSASTVYEEKVRLDILEFFGANPIEYDVILTNNASGALKIVGESYPFNPSRKFLLTWDAHNSVNGIREFAKQKGSEVVYVMLEESDSRVKKQMLKEGLDNDGKREDCGLFALTGQSNVTGVKAELSWTKYAKARGWDVLLDASALAPSTPIDLSKYPVDFMAVSFYKMFGYPTGVGCMVIRKEMMDKLQKPWFGGGTVDMVAVPSNHTLSEGHKRFEDGTLNYLSFSAISLGLAFLRPVQKTLSERITILVDYLIKEFTSMRHGTTGPHLVHIAGPKNSYLRGGTISFYLIDAHGTPIPHLFVERLANKHKISLRTGCLCNPGATLRGMDLVDRLGHVEHGMSVEDFLDTFDEYFNLLVRISVGIASNWEDCEAIVKLFKKLLDPVFYEEARKEIGDVTVTALC